MTDSQGSSKKCDIAERLRTIARGVSTPIAVRLNQIEAVADEIEAASTPEPYHGMPTVARLDSMFAGDDLPPESRNVLSVEVTKEQWQSAKAELIARRHGLTAEQVSNARESLLEAVAERVRASQPPSPSPWRTFQQEIPVCGKYIWWSPGGYKAALSRAADFCDKDKGVWCYAVEPPGRPDPTKEV